MAFAAVVALSLLPAIAADEQKFEMRAEESVKTLLADAVGRQVTLLMSSGQEVTGIVVKVGDHAVHLSRLTGRDFFDAVIMLERVDGVAFKVRGK
jgi:hypothetical protein